MLLKVDMSSIIQCESYKTFAKQSVDCFRENGSETFSPLKEMFDERDRLRNIRRFLLFVMIDESHEISYSMIK